MYESIDELIQAYLNQMEEIEIASSKKEAWEEKEEEIQTLKTQLESMDTETNRVREKANKLDAELKMAKEG